MNIQECPGNSHDLSPDLEFFLTVGVANSIKTEAYWRVSF